MRINHLIYNDILGQYYIVQHKDYRNEKNKTNFGADFSLKDLKKIIGDDRSTLYLKNIPEDIEMRVRRNLSSKIEIFVSN